MSLTKYALLSTLLMALPVSAFAQSGDAPEVISSATMVVSGKNSPARTYVVKNFGVSASTNYSGNRDVNVSFMLLTPPDATMLQWMKQGGPDSIKKVVVTVRSKDTKGTASEIKFTLDEARILNFSAFQSSETPMEFSVQMAAATLVINGVPD